MENNQQQDTKRLKTEGDFRAAGSKSRVLVTIPAHSTTKGEQITQLTPSGLNPGPAPTLISYAGPAPLPSGASKGTCYLFLLPHESPNKALLPLILCLAFYQLLLIESRSPSRG